MAVIARFITWNNPCHQRLSHDHVPVAAVKERRALIDPDLVTLTDLAGMHDKSERRRSDVVKRIASDQREFGTGCRV